MMNVMVPLDGSDGAECLLPYIRSLGQRDGVHINLMCLNDPLYPTPYGVSFEVNQQNRGKIVASRSDYLSGVGRRLALQHISCWTVMGSLREEIFRGAKDQDCHLIVMALGAQTEEVVCMSPCPVLLIRSPGPQAWQFQHILVPIDGSPPSLQVHLQLAPFSGSNTKITLLAASGLTAQDSDYQLSRARLESYMEKLETDLKSLRIPGGMQFAVQVVDGEAGVSILGWAQQEGCDLIAMSSRGHSSIRSFLLGSVTQRILRESACSVLVFPEH